jgi:hypothetical protein
LRKKLSRLCVVAVAALGLAGVLTAGGAIAHPVQHGTSDGHLPGTGAWGNIELLGKAILTNTPELVADVGVNPAGTYAFLANWGEPDCAGPETGGQTSPDSGVWIVDIGDLRNPKKVGFINGTQDSRPGEGVQVANVTTPFFSGDVLAINSEICIGALNGKGGVSFYDVSDPLNPRKLSEHFGDKQNTSDSNETHSVFVWDAGSKAYAVMVDNIEFPDVDILDITKPNRPRLIAEYDLNDYNVDQPELGLTVSGIHDMIVKEIGGRFIMLVSYWDGGYVKLDVTDPVNPVFIGDSDYKNPDPELLAQTGLRMLPEGNGHQAEFTIDNKYVIATDEDFAPYTVGSFEIQAGYPNAGTYPSVGVGGGAPVTILPDRSLNGPTAYVGYACPGTSAAVPSPAQVGLPALAPGEEAIAVIQRGPSGDPSAPEEACFPGEKAQVAIDAGWDAVVLVQRHLGTAAADDTAPFCGSGAFTSQIVTVCTTHEAFHKIFNTEPNYALPYPDEPNTEPDLGTLGAKVQILSAFDGWGYVHLFKNDANLTELDTFAVPEAMQEEFATGYGDLSVHEVAVDPDEASRAYLSYYDAGLRALEIRRGKLVETGGYIDPNGNDFWGVETFVRNGRTIILGSDRDSGLWIFGQKS